MGRNNRKTKKRKGQHAAKRPAKQPPTGKRPQYTSRPDVQDFLDVTPVHPAEAIGCVMFAAPGETMVAEWSEALATRFSLDKDRVRRLVDAFLELYRPKLGWKYVGGAESVEKARQRIQDIEDLEPAFHIWMTENGKWNAFDPDPEQVENEDYREEQLNEIVKQKKLQDRRTQNFFRSELQKRVERARLEGTVEGQKLLLEEEEPYQAVEHRAEQAEQAIQEMREKIEEFTRTKELALKKAEHMRQLGLDKVDPAVRDAERLAKLQQVAATPNVADPDMRTKFEKLEEIEQGRKYPENLGQAMAEHHQKMFDATPVIPQQQRAATDDKGKQEAD